jgi:dTDP-4-amino-4,6-dideoxygalactose transaminase
VPEALAILGGKPTFPDGVPLVRPTLPAWDAELAAEVGALFGSGMLTKGPRLEELEERMAAYLGVRNAVGVANCTLGLLLTMQALGLEGEVIVPSFTFMATVHPVRLLGMEPVFVDIDPRTWNVDPAEVERAITSRTSAIVPVHLFGNPADVPALEAIASRHGLRLVFDAAHGFGARHRGNPLGRNGIAEVFSMSPTKLLVAGEGGIVATEDDDLAQTIRVGREYGNDGNYDSAFAGLNARLAEFNAILAIRGLGLLDDTARSRRAIAAQYAAALASVPGVTFQQIDPADEPSYKDWSMRIDAAAFGASRDALAAALRAESVDSRPYFDPPVHRHRAYADLFSRYQEALPVTDTIAAGAISLPAWAGMSPETVGLIADAVVRIQARAADVGRAATAP